MKYDNILRKSFILSDKNKSIQKNNKNFHYEILKSRINEERKKYFLEINEGKNNNYNFNKIATIKKDNNNSVEKIKNEGINQSLNFSHIQYHNDSYVFHKNEHSKSSFDNGASKKNYGVKKNVFESPKLKLNEQIPKTKVISQKDIKLNYPKSNYKSKKYNIIECILPNSGYGNLIIKDAATGFGVKPMNMKLEPCDGLTVTYGILRGTEILLRNCMEQKKDFLYIDHAYFLRGHNNGIKSYYRTILNDLHCNYIDDNPDDERLKKFGVKVKDWRKNGTYVLVCPPTDAVINFYGVSDWLDNVMRDIRKYTDRPIKIKFKKTSIKINEKYKIREYNKFYREKYKEYVCDLPIEEDFKNTWCLITFSSNIALEAILNGIPVICGKECCAYPVAQHDLSQIENPIYPDIYKWLCTLANKQFSREEMMTGYAWEFLGL